MLRPEITTDDGFENLVMVINLIWAHMWPGAPDGTKRSLEPVWPVLFDQQLPLGAFANCTCGSQKPKMIPTKVCECALCANACQKLCAL